MNMKDNWFPPEDVDEAIERASHISPPFQADKRLSSSSKLLINDLQHISQEDKHLLERAWIRLEEQINEQTINIPHNGRQQEAIFMHDTYDDTSDVPFPERSPRLRIRQSHISSVSNSIAAALLLLVLLGSSLLLFSHRPGTAHRGTTQISVAATQEPTHLVPLSHASCLSDPGLDGICTEGYYKLVHITNKFNGVQPFTVTVRRLYADSLRGAIGFTVTDAQGKLPDGMRVGTYNINWLGTTENGHHLPTTQGSTFYGDDSTLPYNPRNFTGMMYAVLDTSSLPSGIHELVLHLQAQLVHTVPSKSQPGMMDTVNLGTAHFDVSMPLYQAYSFHPHVTKHGNGLNDVVINKLTIARSETIITLTGADTFTSWFNRQLDIRPALVVNGVVYDEYTSENPNPGGNITSVTLVFPQALYEKLGTWQLRLLTLDAAGKLVNTTTFQFVNQGL